MGDKPEHVGAILLRIINRWAADLEQAEQEQEDEPEAAESEDNSEAVRRP